MHVHYKKYQPEFCFIAPKSYLDYTTCSRTHLVLAHIVDADDQYTNFYSELSSLGHYIILDNSAYELKDPYSPEKLVELGVKCGANAIVLPDYPFKASSVTINAAEQFIPIFKEHGFHTFYVPQSEINDWDDWVNGYKWGACHPDIDIIGMSILGIPNSMTHVDPSYARVVATQRLIDAGVFNFDKHHHYLGLNSGPALEIPSLIRMQALDTVDSSGPIWAAILGHAYTKESDSYQMVSKIKLPVDFGIKRSKDVATLARVEHNIRLTQQLFNTNTTTSVWYAQE